jgi:hypothetical protein
MLENIQHTFNPSHKCDGNEARHLLLKVRSRFIAVALLANGVIGL